ncbi:MAG: hypothetical protein ABSA05_11035 [Opitutaceae bacterium]|jgi:hypothetical protein
MKSASRFPIASPVELKWSHYGVPHRVTTWPEVRFERLSESGWLEESPSPEACASAAACLDGASWWRYLDFVPATVREFLDQFDFGRLEALLVIGRCPGLLGDLCESPALTPFVACHASLRGVTLPCWEELCAIHERSGVFGVLEWLGLPASRQTLAILRQIGVPDLPRRFLEPIRALLWEPDAIIDLKANPITTGRELALFCHRRAA